MISPTRIPTPELPPGYRAGYASAAEQDAVLGQTHPFWGDRRSLEEYRARTRELQSTPWGSQHYRFWVLRDPSGRPASSCKTYDLPLWVAGQIVPGVGIGAVFTAPEERRRGHARALLTALLAERARCGDRLATLFSDIEPAYYERLGFVGLEVGKWATAPSRLPPVPEGLSWREAAASELSLITAMARAETRRFDFAYERGAARLAHLSFAYAAPFRFLVRGGGPVGFVLVHATGTDLDILEWGIEAPCSSLLLLGALRWLLPEGCTAVTGWLPPDDPTVSECFERVQEPDAIWMVAALSGDAPDPRRLAASRHHAWADDHF